MGLLLVVVLLLPGLAAALASRPFEPGPSLAWLRGMVTGMTLVAGGLLIFSLSQRWWVVEDWEREATLVTRGSSPFVLILVSVGLLSGAAAVARVWGRRNWAPLGLIVTWFLAGISWYASTGEFTDSDASGEVGRGLQLATLAVLLLTVVALFSSLSLLVAGQRTPVPASRPQDADRPQDGVHARSAARPGPSPSGQRPALSGWDVAAATAMVGIAVAGMLGVIPFSMGFVILVLMVAGLRWRALAAAKRSLPTTN